MKIPTVEKCCCGCSLYCGALFLAICFTIGMLSSVLSVLGGASTESYAEASLEALITVNNDSMHMNVTEINEVVHLLHPLFQVVDGMVAVRCILLLVLCFCLIYGIVKRSAAFILPWLITTTFLTLYDVITMIGVAILIMVFSLAFGIVVLFMILVNLALNLYYLVVIYSYYKQVKTPT